MAIAAGAKRKLTWLQCQADAHSLTDRADLIANDAPGDRAAMAVIHDGGCGGRGGSLSGVWPSRPSLTYDQQGENPRGWVQGSSFA